MTKNEQAKKLHAQGKTISEISKDIGISRRTIGRWLHGETKQPRGKNIERQENKTAKTLADFRKAYDKATIIPARIKAALRSLGNAWEYEKEFLQRAGISAADLGNFRDQFEEYWLPIRKDSKRAWAGTATLARAMREML